MKSLATILSFLVLAVLAAARFAGAGAIMAAMPPHYGGWLVNTLGVLTAIAAAILLDRLVRALYWDGYLRRKLGRETPAVIESLLTIALIMLGASIGLYFEAGVSFTGLITASGATAIILGIALQAAINDVFSGLSVNLDGSFAIGDWLTVYSEHFPEPVFGRVQGITWRITILRLSDGRRLIVPNHVLTANPVMNHSRPRTAKRLFVEVPVAGHFPAERAIAILLAEAFRAVRSKPLSNAREPEVLVDRFDSDAVYFHVRFYANLDESDPQNAKSAMAVALLRALQRHRVPSPVTQVELVPPQEAAADAASEARKALSHVAIFENILRPEQLDALVAACEARAFLPQTVFIRQGEEGTSMFLILEGAARVSVSIAGGEVRDVAVLVSGDMVGEMSLLTGAPRTASVTSLSAMRVLEVTKGSIESLLAGEPGLFERFSHVLAARQLGLSEIANTPSQKLSLQKDILTQMRRFFSHIALGGRK
jgi:small-conductance mechanosensitive channel/CRP-like cAMP-binding protein